MTARRIKWKTYWNFAKLIKRWPRKPERTIINAIAEQAVEMLKEPLSFYGLPVTVADRLEPGEQTRRKTTPEDLIAWGMCPECCEPQEYCECVLEHPCPKCHDTGFVLVHGPEDYGASFESESCECEIGQSYVRAEESLCGCGHGDYRTCSCEDEPDWPEDD